MAADAPILYVEDDDLVGRAISFGLGLGPALERVASVREARDALARARRALVITDLWLADGTGFDVIAAAKVRGGGSPQVLLCTAFPSRG